MNLEVEIKAPLKDAKRKVEALGARHVRSVAQTDTYFSHPSRDLAKTDEAFRIRESDGTFLTYKGPKQSKDLKARMEIEFPVPKDAYMMLSALGFEKAFTIKKSRDMYELEGLSICCDIVEGLGEYVEVEGTSIAQHDRIMDVMEMLGAAESATTKSYSELLAASSL